MRQLNRVGNNIEPNHIVGIPPKEEAKPLLKEIESRENKAINIMYGVQLKKKKQYKYRKKIFLMEFIVGPMVYYLYYILKKRTMIISLMF